MEILDLDKQLTKKPIPPGTVIHLQGRECQAFNFLHSGLVELLLAPDPGVDDTPEKILESSIRIGLVKGEAMLGIISLLGEDGIQSITIRAVSKCIMSSYPSSRDELLTRISRDNTLNFKLLRDLCSRIDSSIYLYSNYKYLWHKYASIADSLALGYPGKPGSIYDEKSRTESTLSEYSAHLKAMIKEDPIAPLPEEWDYNLFLGRIQDNLRLYDDHDKIRAEDLIDHPQFLFVKRLIHKNDKILAAIFNKDEPSNKYIFDFLARCIIAVVTANKDIAFEIRDLMDRIYADEGWAVQIIKEGKDKKKNNFLHFLAKFSWRCRKDTMTLLGVDLFTSYKVFSALKRYQDFESEEEKAPAAGSAITAEEKKRLAKYRGILPRILEFSTLDEDFKKDFSLRMEQLLQYKNKHDSDPELQKLRDLITADYWMLYENCFLKVIDSDLKGFVPGIMLHFGVVDERLLTEEELAMIDRFYSANLFMHDDIPVMTLPYFLEKIHNSEIPPSMTEMGDTFPVILKNQTKMTKKERTAAAYLYKDTAEDKVRFEIRNIACDLSKMLFGNKKKALPFLCSDSLSGGVQRFFLDPEYFSSLVLKYRKRDYSLFYREVLHKHKLGSDFVQKEVIPNFVFYPCFGNRSIMWQEMDGTSKNSRGRLFYPLFFTEKLEENIVTQLANFRWELQKSIAGYNWTDPVEGGVVGVYYDYIQYYRKNPNITPEAKERLSEFIKKTKSDKDRFASDYANWVQFEYEGKMRLNGYARDIFYRFCTFPAEVREVMARKPDFKVMENRLQSRRLKESLKLKSKMIKFEKKGVPLPRELMEYSLFLER
ncbi:MAG: hypothetical protein PQJ50_01460 [Spirochaetales bacterium]|nr:hypothetical protein [Spirochaetales bacterium]